MQAIGQVKHHFWGDYCADVILEFSCEESAQSAVRLLPGWRQGKQYAAKRMSSDELEAFKAQFQTWGGKVRPCGHSRCRHQCRDAEIDNVNHSLEHGPIFDLNVPAEHINQLNLI